ncbi:MFS transporter [Pararhizobium sp. IMCC21322]|uniref:MFS transporter n=1 Tax=Pararhizobium sp. IMCC21322 TaxID=3067903 RepID=UPI002740625C|nr:MFS transporter [Pararhizobium sp. IMCC21322]
MSDALTTKKRIWRTPWRAVSAMFILNGALFGIWASRIPAVATRHDLAPGQLGVLLLLMAAGAIVSFPLAGRAADRLGSAAITRHIALAYILSLIVIALMPNVWLLGVALFLFGMAHGAMDVAMNVWAAEVERKSGRPLMSSFHAMFSFGAGLGAASGYVAASANLSMQFHFILAAGLFGAVTFWFSSIGWISEKTDSIKASPVFSLPKGPLFFVGFIAFCASIGEGAMADWSAIFLVEVARANDANAALGYTLFSLAMVLTRLVGDRIIVALGPVSAARLAGLVAASGSALAVISAEYLPVLLGFALMGIGYAVVMPLAFSRAANDSRHGQGQAIASVATLGYGGMLLGPPLIGFAAEATSIRFAFLILCGLALAIVVLAKILDSSAAEA